MSDDLYGGGQRESCFGSGDGARTAWGQGEAENGMCQSGACRAQHGSFDAFGVSQRDIPICMEEVLDTRLLSGWVNGQLAKRETKAAEINQGWQPSLEETLSGDEIYSNGSPNLLVVGNEKLFVGIFMR